MGWYRWFRSTRPRPPGELAPLSCRELVELVTDYLEGDLPLLERTRFEEHLAGCRGCSAHLEQMRLTLMTLGTIPEDAVSPEARNSLLHSFRHWRR